MIRLKSFTLRSRVIQSPMAGCTDLAFRLFARQYGMEFCFLEMVSSEALVRNSEQTARLMKRAKEDSPLGAQIVGCRPEIMGEAAEIVESMGFDWIDINLGCPVPKITGPGGGSALLREPQKAKQIIEQVVRRVKKIPVTVKMRKGYSDTSGEEAVTIARIAEDAGANAVTLHGRTREQGYSGQADWEAIGKVKRRVTIPVFGNGDVTSGASARAMIATSGCDGVMIGRGALGNPWIYRSIEAALNGQSDLEPPSFEEQKNAAQKHFELEIAIEGDRIGVLKSRRILSWYFKSHPKIGEFRNSINRAQTADEIRHILEGFNPEQPGSSAKPSAAAGPPHSTGDL